MSGPEDNPRDDEPIDREEYEKWETAQKKNPLSQLERCPKCKSADILPHSQDMKICVGCNHRWYPAAVVLAEHKEFLARWEQSKDAAFCYRCNQQRQFINGKCEWCRILNIKETAAAKQEKIIKEFWDRQYDEN